MSRHRFDHKVDRNDDTKTASAPARLRRVEIITGMERRRKWSLEEKAKIVAESFAEGAVVSEVARRHGLNPQQLFGWRAQLRDGVAVSDPSGGNPSSAEGPKFVPAVVMSVPPPAAFSTSTGATGTSGADPAPIEIVLGQILVRVRGQADLRALMAVLKALQVRR
jgi:transposase